MTPAQRHAYVEAHMTVQQHIAQANLHFQQSIATQGSHRQHVIKENDQQHHQTSQTSSSASTSTHHHHQYTSNIKIPQITSSATGSSTTSSTYTTIPDDGLQALGYDSGIRVLQSIGSAWPGDIPSNIPRPNLIPFTEPYAEGGSLNPNSRSIHHVKASHSSTATSSRKSRATHSSNSTAPKAFECTVCGKGLARKDKLTIHMRIHTVSLYQRHKMMRM